MRKFLNIALIIAALSTAACSPLGLALGAGATAGIAATQEGGIKGSATDFRIRTEINDLWFKANTDMFRKLNLSVDQGRVLITGVVQDPMHRLEAVRLAWQPRGVAQVINEIQVADSEGISGYARDTWITTKLRTQMTFDADIQSINYSIETVRGVVYLMGTARSQTELDYVVDLARSIKNVKQVVSYVKMMGEPVLRAGPTTTGTSVPAPAPPPSGLTRGPSNAPTRAQPVWSDDPMVAPAPDGVEKITLPP
jgi:osmotically-inducible protein OsmY